MPRRPPRHRPRHRVNRHAQRLAAASINTIPNHPAATVGEGGHVPSAVGIPRRLERAVEILPGAEQLTAVESETVSSKGRRDAASARPRARTMDHGVGGRAHESSGAGSATPMAVDRTTSEDGERDGCRGPPPSGSVLGKLPDVLGTNQGSPRPDVIDERREGRVGAQRSE